MTTAARPTWDTAKGGTSAKERDLSSMSKQYSSRDLPSHTKLKTREHGQGTVHEHRDKDFRRELEDRERTEDQLMPLSSSMPLSELSGLDTADCLNAELKSLSGGSNPSELE